MASIRPARIGLLFDYIGEAKEETARVNPDVIDTFNLVADDFLKDGRLDRPVEFVLRHVEGLPRGSFRAVRDAFHELVAEDCLVIFGPWISENAAPLRTIPDSPAAPAGMRGEIQQRRPHGGLRRRHRRRQQAR